MTGLSRAWASPQACLSVPVKRQADALDTGGRGLGIIECLCVNWSTARCREAARSFGQNNASLEAPDTGAFPEFPVSGGAGLHLSASPPLLSPAGLAGRPDRGAVP